MINFVVCKFKGIRKRIMHLFRPKQTVVKQIKYRGANFVVLANEDVGWRLISVGKYEATEISVLEELICENDVCVDIGANIGIYSVFFALKAYGGQVIAFEPVELNRKLLELNLVLNGIDNVRIEQSVISDCNGKIKFSVSNDASYSSIISTGRMKESEVIEVDSKTLDNQFYLLRKKIDVLKIDVEGAELLVLRGGKNLLSDVTLRPKVIIVEVNKENQSVYGYNPIDVIDYMEEFGYNTYSLKSNGKFPGWSPDEAIEDVIFLSAEYECDM